MRKLLTLAVLLISLVMSAAAQQAAIAFCSLDKDIDFKTAKAGDAVSMKLTRDLKSGDSVLLPKGTAVTAHLVDAKDTNTVSIVLDKAVLKSGKEVPLMGIIAALATPLNDDLTRDPLFGMNHSTEVSQHSMPGTGLDPNAGVGSSGAAAQTAILKGGANQPKSSLSADSSGTYGIDGLKMTYILDKPPATTVLTAKKKNFKLKGGTEVLLRMAPPEM